MLWIAISASGAVPKLPFATLHISGRAVCELNREQDTWTGRIEQKVCNQRSLHCDECIFTSCIASAVSLNGETYSVRSRLLVYMARILYVALTPIAKVPQAGA